MTRQIPVQEPARLLRVVIADADPDTRSMYREALRALPLDIVEAADGRDALVTCLLERPALLITETQLPIIDGFELCQLLRRDPQTQSVRVLIVTADARPAQLTRARHLASAVLAKPVSMDSFALLVGGICEQAETETPADADAPVVPAGPRAASRTFRRFETTTPRHTPPDLRCTACDRALEYRKSRVGGVTQQQAEQWDEFRCSQCGRGFEYRHRTKRLRILTA